MNNLKWLGHQNTITSIFQKLYNDQQNCDVTISTKGREFAAHRFILSTSSDYFREIFDGVPEVEVKLIVPDFKDHIIEALLSFIYTGEVFVASSNLSEFLETINFLGIKSAISFEVQINKTETDSPQAELATEKPQVSEGNSAEQQTDKDLEEYLEVYNEDEKMQQYIDQECSESNSEYILAEDNQHEFTLAAEIKQEKLSEKRVDEVEVDFSDFPDLLRESKNVPSIATKSTTSKMKAAVAERKLSRQQLFDGAIKAVINNGMSLQKAATKFNVSKTVLWRRVKKNSAYKSDKEHPMLSVALQKLENGEPLKSISKALNIPISTLHRHKVRLAGEGRLPEHVQVRKRDARDNLKRRLDNAIAACNRGMSQNHAAIMYAVPKSTLWRHLQKHIVNEAKTEITDEVQMCKE